MKRAKQRHVHRRGPGAGTRILLLGLIPLVALSAVLGVLVGESRRRIDNSRQVSAQIARLLDLSQLHMAMTTERLATLGLARFDTVGITEEFVNEQLDLDVSDMLDTARARVDAGLAALSSTGVLPGDEIDTELASIRSDMQSPTADGAELSARFEVLLDEIEAAFDREMLGPTSDAATTHRGIGASLARMRAALDAFRFGSLQLSSMGDFWFADEESRPQAVRSVTENTALFEKSMALLRESGDPAIEEWEAVLASPELATFDAAVESVMSGGRLPPGPIIEQIVPAFTAATFRQRQLGELATLTADDAQSRAHDAEEDASREIWQLAVLGTVVVVATLALAGFCAYSIARPLRRLIDRTERIRDGDLTPDARRLTGPHDLRLAAATVEELVDNLRLLDAKAVALARYDLDDPVLNDDLTGPLGASLQRSAAVLRESIAAREELQQRLWHAANHDSLTGIANRSSAIEKLRTALAAAEPSRRVAVLFVDLDDFKRANDAHGHAVGDEILRVTASRMNDVVRPSDIVGRLGGDEFVIGLAGVTDAAMARSLAERLLEVVRQPIVVNGIEVRVGASIGVAIGLEGDSPSDVMARADLAVYQAKQRSTSIHVYDEALHREVQTRTTLEKDLQVALTRDDELSLHYQPIVDVYTDEVLRVEALLRWHRPGHGDVSPDEFIPAAEMSSLIVDVDRWVLRRAMTEAAQWAGTALHDAIGVAINVSGRHVAGDSFVRNVRNALDRSGIDPSRVTLELTESALVDDLERAAANLRAVRELGVGVYIDDFGTGYTSIAHLHSLPIDGIKIDRSFVRSLSDPRELTLVRTVIELGIQLGLTVVAEGVETDEQRSIVASLGCESIQGFLVGRPCPPDEIRRRLAEERATTRV